MTTDFDGETYDAALDGARLAGQLAAVRDAVAAGEWWTLAGLAHRVGASEASVSARLRDLRKPKFGGWVVVRERVAGGNGLHRYRVSPGHGVAVVVEDGGDVTITKKVG